MLHLLRKRAVRVILDIEVDIILNSEANTTWRSNGASRFADFSMLSLKFAKSLETPTIVIKQLKQENEQEGR